jgi:hypothetical protein
MSGNNVRKNERRFRRGTLLLFLVSALSAGSTAAIYYGANTTLFYTTSLAVPVVTDIALKTYLDGWIFLEKVQYYWFLFSMGFAAVLGAIALLCGTISLSGHAFHRSFAGRSISKLFSAFGAAQLMSSRALSAFGLLFYLMDGVVSAVLVLALPQTFTAYYFFIMANLLLHLIVLTYLGYCFSARIGGGKDAEIADSDHHGASREK